MFVVGDDVPKWLRKKWELPVSKPEGLRVGSVHHRVVNFVQMVEHGEGTWRVVERSVNVSGRRDPAKVLGMLKTFHRVGTSGGTR